MANPLIYMIRADIDEDYVHDHHVWYATKHAPDLMAAGFWSARGYNSSASPGLWNIYEVPDVAIFSSEAYTAGHKSDAGLETRVKKLHGRTVSVYSQIHSAGADGREQARIPSLSGQAVTSLRFDTAKDPAAVLAWFSQEVVRRHMNTAGLRSVRLWEQRERHPKWASTEPRWSVGAEWAAEEGIGGSSARALLEEAAAHPAIAASNVSVDIVRRRYGLVREDVFEA